jgi:membrane fusion protein, heavy metal efflux system
MSIVAVIAAALVIGLVVYFRMPSTPSHDAAQTAMAPDAPVDSVRFGPGAAQLSAIRVEPAVRAPLPLAEPMNGRLAYDENYTARVAAPIAGRVTDLKVQPGDSVKAGDSLLILDSPDLAAAIADVRKAGFDEVRKRLALERTRQLVEAGVVPRKDLENAQADFDGSHAETDRSQRRLRNLAPRGGPTDGGGYALRSPIAGIVADRKVNPGSEVRPDLPDPLFTITDPTRLWVLIDLPERDLAKVQVGRPASVQVDAYPELRFEAVIERIGEIVDPATRRVQVRASLRNVNRKLKPEMYTRVTLIADAGELVVRVPNSALVTQGLYSYIFVETEPGLFKRRQVTLSVQDREFAYVVKGVAADDRIVTTGALLLNSELSTSR